MVTDRDEKALEFIELFGIVTAKQVSRAVYNQIQTTGNRLLRFTKDKLLHRVKNAYDGGYCYSVKKIRSLKQYRHYYVRTELYLAMLESGCRFVDVKVDKTYGSVRPDAVMSYYTSNNELRFIFVEVELRVGATDINKYNAYFCGEYEEYFNKIPLVVYVTEKQIKWADFDYITIDTKLKQISKIL